MSNIVVVGGGAAGLMAAYAASQAGARVLLLEQNEKLGKKIYITGKGRCNFTNACAQEDFFLQMVSNGKFMYSSFYAFDNQQVMELFAHAGMKYKIERGNRVFPVSDHASDVTNTLADLLRRQGGQIRLHSQVKEILLADEPEGEPRVRGVRLTSGEEIGADALILATGGRSYPVTGSRGDGHKMAKQLGHKITPLRPALVPMQIAEQDLLSLQGLSLKNVSLRIYGKARGQGKRKILYDVFGEMLFTHFGISGPLVLTASSRVGAILEKEGPLVAEIDLKAALSEEELDLRLQREIASNINKSFKNLLPALLPAKIIPLFLERTGIAEDKKMHDLRREDRARVLELLKHFPLTITGLRSFREAIITQGGIRVREVNPSTMESKLVRSLYFAGEILDLDAVTGGYNLQIAWSTGHLAGQSAAEAR